MKKHLGLALRIAVSVALLAFAFSRVPLWDTVTLLSGEILEGRLAEMGDASVRLALRADGSVRDIPAAGIRGGISEGVRAGVVPVFGRIHWAGVCLPFLLIGLLNAIMSARWRMLVRTVGGSLSLRSAYELVTIGLFLSMLPLGAAGGDVARAVFVARNSQEKTRLVLSILVDRAAGILGLLVLVCGATLFAWSDPRFAGVRAAVLAVSLAGMAGGVLIVSRRLRTLVGWDWLLEKRILGGLLGRVDEALTTYGKSPSALAAALAISVGLHAGLVVAHWLLARVLSVESVSLADFMVLIPILTTVRAASIMGGLGVSELAAQHLLHVIGIPAAQAMAISLLVFLGNFTWSLLGGIFLLTARHQAVPDAGQTPRP